MTDVNTQKPTEPIALVDMDGTLADFDGAMQAELGRLMGPHESLPPERESWDELPPWIQARQDLIRRQPGFWRQLPLIPDGFAVLEKIRRAGFQVTILSKGPFKTPAAWTEKDEWCREHVPDTPVIICEDKGLIYGRVLFDDWPPYIERWLEWRPRGLVIMLDHPWNRSFQHPNVFRYRRGLDPEPWQEQDAHPPRAPPPPTQRPLTRESPVPPHQPVHQPAVFRMTAPSTPRPRASKT
jgi:5'(3')-deoxyribonucleotidase